MIQPALKGSHILETKEKLVRKEKQKRISLMTTLMREVSIWLYLPSSE